MKITLGQLRELIREELTLEAPLADILPVVSRPEDHQYTGPDYDKTKEPTKVKKFFSSPGFKDQAVKRFQFLSIPVYLIPRSRVLYAPNMRQRLKVYEDSASQEQFLRKRCNLPPEKIDELINAMKSGASVIVPEASRISVGEQPSPWMIVHAMLDNVDNKFPLYVEIQDMIDDLPEGGADLAFGALTMKSARTSAIQASSDAAAEIITQAITTSKGFHYNLTGNRRVDYTLLKIKKKLEWVREDFENMISGKLIVVNLVSEI